MVARERADDGKLRGSVTIRARRLYTRTVELRFRWRTRSAAPSASGCGPAAAVFVSALHWEPHATLFALSARVITYISCNSSSTCERGSCFFCVHSPRNPYKPLASGSLCACCAFPSNLGEFGHRCWVRKVFDAGRREEVAWPLWKWVRMSARAS